MRQRVINEIGYQLDNIVQEKMDNNPYGDEDFVREYVAREFAEWLVNKFKEECDVL